MQESSITYSVESCLFKGTKKDIFLFHSLQNFTYAIRLIFFLTITYEIKITTNTIHVYCTRIVHVQYMYCTCILHMLTVCILYMYTSIHMHTIHVYCTCTLYTYCMHVYCACLLYMLSQPRIYTVQVLACACIFTQSLRENPRVFYYVGFSVRVIVVPVFLRVDLLFIQFIA